MKSEIHSFAAVRSSASAPRNSTEPSRSETNFARPNVVMIRSDLQPHNDLIRFFITRVCRTGLDKECPGVEILKEAKPTELGWQSCEKAGP
jgi:hypothetical protein